MSIATRIRRVGLPRLIVHISVLFVVLLWLLPTLGILVSSLRDKDQLVVSGWWTAFSSSSQTQASRLADPATQRQEGDRDPEDRRRTVQVRDEHQAVTMPKERRGLSAKS